MILRLASISSKNIKMVLDIKQELILVKKSNINHQFIIYCSYEEMFWLTKDGDTHDDVSFTFATKIIMT